MHYVGNRSLWMDEAKLALNFVQSPVWGFFQPLLHNQIAPAGFLLIEKLAVEYFGDSEYILRLYPFIAGMLSVFLIYKLAFKVFGAWVGLTALTIFSISHWAIYYAAEVKQYSSDMMVALILYITVAYAVDRWSVQRWLLLTIVGMFGVWLSHPVAFILAGIGVCKGVKFLTRQQWSNVFRIGLSSVVWLGSFALGLYATSTIGSDPAGGSETLSHMTDKAWTGSFAPFPPTSIADIRWYSSAFSDFFHIPLGFTLKGLAAFLFLTGIVHLWTNNRLWLGLLVIPILITLAASAFHLYPFSSRLLVFLVPGTIIVIAVGVEAMRQFIWDRYRAGWFILITLLLFQPAWSALSNALHKSPYHREDIKTVLDYINKSRVIDDKVYVYYGATDAFRYYRARYHITESAVIWGDSAKTSWDGYLSDVQKMQCFNRVWLVFSHIISDRVGVDEERLLLFFLDKVGTRLHSIKANRASGYLYRFSPATISTQCDRSTPIE